MDKIRTCLELRTVILKKQCEIVNADFEKLDFTSAESRWFMLYSWTKEQENEFKQWLISFLKELPKGEYYQLSHYSRNKSNLAKIAEEWCFNYGWTYTKT